MSPATRVLRLLVMAGAGTLFAAESAIDRAIEVPAGQTVYFQLTDTTPGRPAPVVRVEDPNRSYAVVKATLEVVAGMARFRIRNGYDDALALQMDAACSSQGSPALVLILRSGAEAVMQVRASATKITLCNMHLVAGYSPQPLFVP